MFLADLLEYYLLANHLYQGPKNVSLYAFRTLSFFPTSTYRQHLDFAYHGNPIHAAAAESSSSLRQALHPCGLRRLPIFIVDSFITAGPGHAVANMRIHVDC